MQGKRLTETLAAAIVLRSGWKKGTPLVDPMCGSGTLLIEAAQMEAQIAPQLHRLHWGFDCWKGHNQDAWDKVKAEAVQQAETYFNQNPKPHFLWLRSRSSRTEKSAKERTKCRRSTFNSVETR